MRDKTPKKLAGLESHLGYWLRQVSNHVSDAFARDLQTRRISGGEWVALRQLYDHEDITSGELSALLGMTRGAISKILDKLESKGLVARITRSEDKRSQALALTLKGKQLLPELAELADMNDAEYFGCLDAEEQAQLRGLLQELAQVHQWHDVPIN